MILTKSLVPLPLLIILDMLVPGFENLRTIDAQDLFNPNRFIDLVVKLFKLFFDDCSYEVSQVLLDSF